MRKKANRKTNNIFDTVWGGIIVLAAPTFIISIPSFFQQIGLLGIFPYFWIYVFLVSSTVIIWAYKQYRKEQKEADEEEAENNNANQINKIPERQDYPKNFNITVDSRDFIGMDKELAKILLDGIQKIVKEQKQDKDI